MVDGRGDAARRDVGKRDGCDGHHVVQDKFFAVSHILFAIISQNTGRESRASSHAGKPHGALRAGRTEEGKDTLVGNLSEVALEIGCVLCAVGYRIVLEDGVLQMVELVEKGVEEL